MKPKHVISAISSFILIFTLASCKEAPVHTPAPDAEVSSYSSGHNYKDNDFSKWMSKADQQIAYEKRDQKTYFAYTEGRSMGGFHQYRHVVQPLPLETHSEWAVYWGLTVEEFYTVDLKLQKAGFERNHLQVFEDGAGKAFYQAVWLKKKK